jgi:helicase
VGLVVLDEAHFITDPSRGITVELLLTYLLSIRERGIAPQLITLSAVIGGTNDFDTWLDCQLLMSEHRPVPLIEGVIDRTGTFQYLDADGQTQTEQFIPRSAAIQRRDKPSGQDVIVPLVKQLVGAGEKVIVFRNQRGKAQGCASYLANALGLPAATEILSLLPTRDNTMTSAKLRECLSGGTAFHTSNLHREEREIVPFVSVTALSKLSVQRQPWLPESTHRLIPSSSPNRSLRVKMEGHLPLPNTRTWRDARAGSAYVIADIPSSMRKLRCKGNNCSLDT